MNFLGRLFDAVVLHTVAGAVSEGTKRALDKGIAEYQKYRAKGVTGTLVHSDASEAMRDLKKDR